MSVDDPLRRRTGGVGRHGRLRVPRSRRWEIDEAKWVRRTAAKFSRRRPGKPRT